MRNLPTHVLLDLADDYSNIVCHLRPDTLPAIVAKDKLVSIDAELLSRMPEEEFITVVSGPLPIRSRHNGGEWVITGYWYQPIGFEPAYYSQAERAQAELDEADSRLDESSYRD